MSKHNPKNREEAFTYQLEDDIKVLRCLSNLSDGVVAYNQQLGIIEERIETYRKLAKGDKNEIRN